MGEDKATMPVTRGTTLLEHAVRQLSPGSTATLLSVGDALRDLPPSLSETRQVLDRLSDQGPLSGIESLLKAAETPWVLIVPCDMPALGAEHLLPLVQCAEASEETEALCFDFHDRPRPFPLLLHVRAHTALARLMDQGQRRLVHLLDSLKVHKLEPSDEVRRATAINLNTPQDWADWSRSGAAGSVDDPKGDC